jgi:D-apiose dehydrogenase
MGSWRCSGRPVPLPGLQGQFQLDCSASEDSLMADPQPSRPVLKVALAGAGMISRHHLISWRSIAPAARVVAVYDPDAERARSRAAEFGVKAVFTDGRAMLDEAGVGALDVAAPRAEHAGWVEAAAARGIDVLCQKPLTPTLAEGEALLGRLGHRMRLMVHENWRFRPWYRTLGRWIADGELGELLHAQMTMMSSGLLPDESGRAPALVRQPFMAAEQRLMIAEVLIHHLDVMRFLCGPLRVVSARAARTLPEVRGETLAAMFLETAAGAPVVVSGTMAAPGLGARTGDRLEVVGSKASAAFADGTLRLMGPRPRSEAFDLDTGYQASFDNTIRHFVECLASGAAFETDAVDNLETLRLVEHAYWAAGRHQVARAD